MRALGADDMIDYTTTDFVTPGPRFAVMLDTVGNRSLSDCRSILVPTGTFVSCSGGTSGTRWLVRMIGMLLTSRFTTRKLKPFIVSLNQPDLLALTALVEAGKIKPIVELVARPRPHNSPVSDLARQDGVNVTLKDFLPSHQNGATATGTVE